MYQQAYIEAQEAYNQAEMELTEVLGALIAVVGKCYPTDDEGIEAFIVAQAIIARHGGVER